jgi:tetratricopeptide (TPR) repeat protein
MQKILALFIGCIIIVSCRNNNGTNTSTKSTFSVDDLLVKATELHDQGLLDSSLKVIFLIQQKDTQNFKAKLLEGDVQWAQRNFKSSMAAYTSCLRWQKKNPSVWARLGKVYLEQADYASALKYFNQAINLDQSFADAYIGRSMVFFKKGEMEQAYTSLQTAIDFDPNNLNAILRMADWQLADSNFIAVQYLNNALRIDSADADIFYKRAKAHFKFENYKQAEKDYIRAFSMKPQSFEYAFNLAYFYFQFGEYVKAQRQFESCLAINPKDLDAWLGKALCQKELNLTAEAINSFEKLLEINPNDEDALRELENLR